MPTTFNPPGITSLAEIDVADISYENQCIVIQGVVSPNSQGGWPGQNDNYQVHCFTFAAWRCLGGPVVRRRLTVLRPVPPDADYSGDFPKYSIQRFSALLSTDRTRAVFEKRLRMDSPDEELLAIAKELQMPVIFSTEQFGDLVLDRSIDWFEGQTRWNGQTIDIHFPVDGASPTEHALNAATLLWSAQAHWKKRIEDSAVKELLKLKNEGWLDENESELTASEFVSRMTLTSISISSEGEFEYWYDDGDLFWGHSIVVSGNLNDGPTDARIEG